MKQLTGNQVRQMFLDYFKSKGHMIEPGASLIPHNDPTLLWINAGVAALKKYFDGSEKPACNRIANAQKSIRTNDIENVGKTARHHTFFEMLGNFSIGDYFKEEAIPFAWEFLTSPEWIGFDKEKLYVTVYTDDEDAYRIWTEVCHVDPSHILKTYENFWEIGEGPGGPDSEIFYDRGEKYDPEGLGEKLFFEEMENDRYIEVWNVVFSQYDCNPAIDRKEYKELPQKNIDTGMGLERLVSIIQGGETNFDTDLFLPIIHATEKLANVSYEENKMAYRVIADHIRTVTFALADGAMFDNAGRGYVLRRILRRAVRYGKQIGIEKAFMYDLVPLVCDMMKDFYDYLPEKQDFISTMVKKEEEAFHKTLLNGEKLLKSLIDKNENGEISGKDAFKLYDTYGFPFELTKEIAAEQGLNVDEAGFKAAMQEQKERAKAATAKISVTGDMKYAKIEKEVGSTNFIGYTDNECSDAKILAQVEGEGYVDIVLDKTPFYAECGGQVGDSGYIESENLKAEVLTTFKVNDLYVHRCNVLNGEVSIGDTVKAYIDVDRREKIRVHHTSAHLLQAALVKVLGSEVKQAGSYVEENRMRFDFTFSRAMTSDEIVKVENLMNKWIGEGYKVNTKVMGIKEAELTGATALFGEKYGDTVRVVSIEKETKDGVDCISKEFCAGTHARQLVDLRVVKIISESAIAAGTRRIEAAVSTSAIEYLNAKSAEIDKLSTKFKSHFDEVVERVEKLSDENRELQKNIEKLEEENARNKFASFISKAQEIEGGKLFISKVEGLKPLGIKIGLEYLSNKLGNSVIILAGETTVAVKVSDNFVKQGINAGKLVGEIARATGANGGGRPNFAQGGVKDSSKLDEILTKVEEEIKSAKVQ